jgi:hypothetical protein
VLPGDATEKATVPSLQKFWELREHATHYHLKQLSAQRRNLEEALLSLLIVRVARITHSCLFDR